MEGKSRKGRKDMCIRSKTRGCAWAQCASLSITTMVIVMLLGIFVVVDADGSSSTGRNTGAGAGGSTGYNRASDMLKASITKEKIERRKNVVNFVRSASQGLEQLLQAVGLTHPEQVHYDETLSQLTSLLSQVSPRAQLLSETLVSPAKKRGALIDILTTDGNAKRVLDAVQKRRARDAHLSSNSIDDDEGANDEGEMPALESATAQLAEVMTSTLALGRKKKQRIGTGDPSSLPSSTKLSDESKSDEEKEVGGNQQPANSVQQETHNAAVGLAVATQREKIRGFETQQETMTEENTNFLRYIERGFCVDGVVAVPVATEFLCGSDYHLVSSTQFITLPLEEQANCTFKDPEVKQRCLCSLDFRLGIPVFGKETCFPQTLNCATNIVDPVGRCPKISVNDPAIDAVCYETSLESSLAVTLNISCRFHYYPDSAFEAFGVLMLSTEEYNNEVFITLPPIADGLDSPIIQQNIVLSQNGSYQTLRKTAFHYVDVTESTNPDQGSLHLTLLHPMTKNSSTFVQVYNFRTLSDQTELKQNTDSYVPGLLSGRVLTTFPAFALGSIKKEFFAGGRLYLESGITSPVALIDNIAASRFIVDFKDYPHPTVGIRVSNTVAIVLIVLACLVGILLLAGIAYAVRRRRQRNLRRSGLIDSDEEEDWESLVHSQPASPEASPATASPQQQEGPATAASLTPFNNKNGTAELS